MKTDNRKRNIPIRVWLSKSENAELSRKAKITGLPKSTVIRLLLNNYEPKEKPDTRFYEAMRQLSAIGNNINQLALKANTLDLRTQKACGLSGAGYRDNARNYSRDERR